jgi:hypothetical protein
LKIAANVDPTEHVQGRVGEPGQDRGRRDVLRAVDVLDADQPDEVRVRLVVVEGERGEAPDGLARLEVVDVELLLQRTDPGVGTLQDRDVQLLLAAEVVVDHPLRRARLRGDLVHPGARVAAVGELAGGDVEDLRTRPLGVALPLGRRVGQWCGHGFPPRRWCCPTLERTSAPGGLPPSGTGRYN